MQDNEYLQNYAIYEDVPFVGTCIDLCFPYGVRNVWVQKTHYSDWEFIRTDNIESWYNRIVYAPQMHEIACRLPVEFYTDCGQHAFYQLLSHIGYGLHVKQGKVESVTIENHHYAQAYAELYLKLRDAGLLEKEVQDGK